MTRPTKGAPTRLNLWVLARLFPDGATAIPNRVASTERAHALRLVRAGLIQIAGDLLRLTTEGRGALATTTSPHANDRAQDTQETDPTNAKENDVPKTKTKTHAKKTSKKPTQSTAKTAKPAAKKTKPTSKSAEATPAPTVAPLPPRDEATAPAEATQETAPAAAPIDAPEATPTTMTTTEPSKGDSRMPPVGTVLRKLDRAGTTRCECVIVAGGGVRYKETVYRSLSAAALAAARDLGLGSKSLDGFAWWGLKPRAAAGERRGRDPLKALDRAWTRLRATINGLLGDDVPEDARGRALAVVQEHAQTLARLGQAKG